MDSDCHLALAISREGVTKAHCGLLLESGCFPTLQCLPPKIKTFV